MLICVKKDKKIINTNNKLYESFYERLSFHLTFKLNKYLIKFLSFYIIGYGV